MRKTCLYFLLVLAVTGCKSPGNRLDVDISKIKIPEVVIHRYDLDLFRMDPGKLSAGLIHLQPQYRFFLGSGVPDTAHLRALKEYLENERNRTLFSEVERQFKDVTPIEQELTEAFRHCLYYFPEWKVPVVYSFISGGDYMNPVHLADSVMLIAFDCYLGRKNEFYVRDALPLYRINRTDPGYLLPDALDAIGTSLFPEGVPGNNLLAQMVEAGKRLWFIDAMIPATAGYLKIGYTEEQYNWAVKNEEHVWAAIIENDLLYSTSGQVMRTFLSDGPFTAEFSKESPPRLGEYIGWRIVGQYMQEHPEVSLRALMQEQDAQKILTQSRYKPSK